MATYRHALSGRGTVPEAGSRPPLGVRNAPSGKNRGMERLRRLGARWPWFGRVLDVHERVGDVNGSVVASAITVSVFVSLFPLLLIFTIALGANV